MLRKGSFSARTGNRDWVSISRSILACAIGGTRKTELIHRVGLSTLQLHKYAKTLTGSQLLETRKRGTAMVYRTTGKGRSFIEAFDRMIKLLD